MGRKGRQRSLSPIPSSSPRMVTMREATDTKSNVTPSKFYGDVGEDFENWIKTFERIGRANRWGPDRKVELLPAYLRGRAADFYEDLDQDIQEDFDRLVDRMKERFCPKELQRMYYTELFQRKQLPRENVEDYGSSILKLARRAHGGVSLDEHDRLVMEHFLQGLRPELRRYVMMADPQSFEQAFRIAKREECNEQLITSSQPEPSKVNVVASEMKILMDSFEKMTGKLDKIAEKLDGLNNTNMKRLPYTRNVQPQNSNQIRNRQTRSCYVCGQPNHLARDCQFAPSTTRKFTRAPQRTGLN